MYFLILSRGAGEEGVNSATLRGYQKDVCGPLCVVGPLILFGEEEKQVNDF
jgi:hypothetical protein